MSYFNQTQGNTAGGSSGFYQPSNPQYAFPQGFMNTNLGIPEANGTTSMGISPDPLPSGLWNALSTKGYAHELPLLEELGIYFDRIGAKTMIVLKPTSASHTYSQEILTDLDLSGPMIFFLVFGLFLLMAGKVHFGYVYGVALFGTVSLHNLCKLMSNSSQGPTKLQYLNTASILGYCFLPLCFLSLMGIFIDLNNTLGYVTATLFVMWSTWSSSGFLNVLLQLHNARTLIVYPLLIFYSVFALMAIFV